MIVIVVEEKKEEEAAQKRTNTKFSLTWFKRNDYECGYILVCDHNTLQTKWSLASVWICCVSLMDASTHHKYHSELNRYQTLRCIFYSMQEMFCNSTFIVEMVKLCARMCVLCINVHVKREMLTEWERIIGTRWYRRKDERKKNELYQFRTFSHIIHSTIGIFSLKGF